MHLTETEDTIRVVTPAYTVEVARGRPRAALIVDGRDWGELSLLASVDRTDLRDETHRLHPVQVVAHEDRVVLTVVQDTAAWRHKATVLTCTPRTVEVHAEVRGTGDIAEVSLLGGRAVLATGAAGTFRSGLRAASVFNPAPTQPVQVVRPATSAISQGVVGDAEPGRLHGLFSPPPMLIALGARPPGGPTTVPDGPWLSVSLRDAVHRMTFTQMRYEPVDGGYLLRLDYEGHTRVGDSWTSPRAVLAGADSPAAAIEAYRADLVAHDLAPPGPVHQQHAWWRRPIFCGWGALCAHAAALSQSQGDGGGLVGGTRAAAAPDLARQDLYDRWLARLAAHGFEPGTVVIDDRWQRHYGLPDPDPAKWPRLGEWIADRHRAGQRVLLWWRAWSPDGVPETECIVDAAGRPVSADPTNPAYLDRLRAHMAALLGPDGLDADGIKLDFTQRAPSGAGLRAHGPGWGVALLHQMLAAMYAAAKQAKPDALMVTQTPHPSFGDVCDMVRLNDVLDSDPHGVAVPAVDQLRFRHAVVSAAMPGHLVDTDQWPMQTLRDWREYVDLQARLGVPALYYVETIDNSGEQITGADLEHLAAAWSAAGGDPHETADPAGGP